MKKSRILALTAILLSVLVFFGITVFLRSPEYALLRIALDVKEHGMDGIRPHLTDDAAEIYDSIATITESKLVSTVADLFQKDEANREDEEKDLQWELVSITRDGERATVYLDFCYEDKWNGTISILLVKEDNEWKISGLELPNLNKGF